MSEFMQHVQRERGKPENVLARALRASAENHHRAEMRFGSPTHHGGMWQFCSSPSCSDAMRALSNAGMVTEHTRARRQETLKDRRHELLYWELVHFDNGRRFGPTFCDLFGLDTREGSWLTTSPHNVTCPDCRLKLELEEAFRD